MKISAVILLPKALAYTIAAGAGPTPMPAPTQGPAAAPGPVAVHVMGGFIPKVYRRECNALPEGFWTHTNVLWAFRNKKQG